MARVVYLPEAKGDLFEIWEHVAQESRSFEVAEKLIDTIDDTCQSYAAQPLMGQARADLAANVRCFPVGKYVVFYLPLTDGIEVIQVIHGARDIPLPPFFAASTCSLARLSESDAEVDLTVIG